MSTNNNQQTETPDAKQKSHNRMGMYIRFGAMILTAVVVMYFVMFADSWEWSHIRLRESRIFMTLTMGAPWS